MKSLVGAKEGPKCPIATEGEHVVLLEKEPSTGDDLECVRRHQLTVTATRPLALAARASTLRQKSIDVLHISDLHIPNRGVRIDKTDPDNPSYSIDTDGWHLLWNHDHARISATRLCVVTGDIAARSPSPVVYKALKQEMQRRYGDRWLTVPGNHDRRIWGNFRLNKVSFDTTFDGWKRTWWNIASPLIIVPLDSNPDPAEGRKMHWGMHLARGIMGKETYRIAEEIRRVRHGVASEISDVLYSMPRAELTKLAGRLWGAFQGSALRHVVEARVANSPVPDPSVSAVVEALANLLAELHLARAVRCLAIHHHPVGIPHTENDGLTGQEAYLALIDSGTLLEEARRQGITLILHGHRHVPHRTAIGLPSSEREFVGIVGCGSTTNGSSESGNTANIVKISASGVVTVDLYRLKEREWQEASSTFRLRSWTDVKRSLTRAAKQTAPYRADTISCEVLVLPEGDALITTSYGGLRPKDTHSTIELPLLFRSSTLPRPPRIASDDRTSDLQLLPIHATDGGWAGLLRFGVKPGHADAGIVTQTVNHCTFATNKWQLYGLYGDVDARERFVRHCSTPVDAMLEIAVRVHDGAQFEVLHADRICEDVHGDDDGAEMSQLQLMISPTRTQVRLSAALPVLGNVYGVSWRWELASDSGPQFGPREEMAHERMRIESEARLSRRSKFCQTMEALLAVEDTRTEICFYGIGNRYAAVGGKVEKTMSASKAEIAPSNLILYQLASNAAVHSVGWQAFNLDFGVGVAGRCAWTAATTPWVTPDDAVLAARPEPEWADFYYRVDGAPTHYALLSLPVTLEPGRAPVGVLSFATRANDSFAQVVRDVIASADSDDESDLPEWIVRIIKRVVEIVRVTSEQEWSND